MDTYERPKRAGAFEILKQILKTQVVPDLCDGKGGFDKSLFDFDSLDISGRPNAFQFLTKLLAEIEAKF